MLELKVRAFRPTDICIGFNETLSELSPTKLSLIEAKKFSLQRRDAGIKTLVALLEEQVVATGSVWLERKFSHNGRKVAHIEDVAVHKSFAGQGIGKVIVNKLIEVAEKANAYKVILDCSNYNVPFYNKLGFQENSIGMRKDLL